MFKFIHDYLLDPVNGRDEYGGQRAPRGRYIGLVFAETLRSISTGVEMKNIYTFRKYYRSCGDFSGGRKNDPSIKCSIVPVVV